MRIKTKQRSEILRAVHETAQGLYRTGLIDKQTMRDFDLTCLDSVPSYDFRKIRKLRNHLRMSQPVFAAVLNTSVSTIRKWEAGDKKPSGPSLKLLHILDKKGIDVML